MQFSSFTCSVPFGQNGAIRNRLDTETLVDVMTKHTAPEMEQPAHKPLSVGFVLSPSFTLAAFSNFVDALRLAADDGDLSRQIRCKWKVLSHDHAPITASCGLEISPTAGLEAPTQFDYIVVVGGLLHAGKRISPQLVSYLKKAAELNVPLVGVCTGSFILARAGLMEGKKTCVSWFHHDQFVNEFPKLPVSAEELFITDGNRLTCAGGTGVVHLAAHLIETHCGKSEAVRALRIMIEVMPLPAKTLQPQPLRTEKVSSLSVQKAMLLIERNVGSPLSVDEIAQKVHVSTRQLERLFHAEVGITPSAFSLKLRLRHAKHLLLHSASQISLIAFECGFIDFSHFSRCFRTEYGISPSQMREEHLQEHKPNA